MKFKVGDRVVLNDESLKKYNVNEDTSVRGIISEASETHDKVLVTWDYINPFTKLQKIQELNISKLLPEAEANLIFSKLENEFKIWSQIAVQKIDEAAALLLQVDALTKTYGYDLHDLYDINSSLLNAMEACGWNISSFNC